MTISNPADDRELTTRIGIATALAGGDPSASILDQEARGQQQLVNSQVLPSEMGDRAGFEAVGFVFGDPVEGDDLFIHATLPEGWRREGSEHAMWSHILDHLGRRRVSVFYKAAFYDRAAHMTLTSVASYATDCANLWGDDDPTMPIMDDRWATKPAIIGALTEWADKETRDADRFEASLPGRTPANTAECVRLIAAKRARITKAREFAAKITES